MAYVILDDSWPEASEYESNHVYFDERRPESIARAQTELIALGFPRAAASLEMHKTESRESLLASQIWRALKKWWYTQFAGHAVLHRRPIPGHGPFGTV